MTVIGNAMIVGMFFSIVMWVAFWQIRFKSILRKAGIPLNLFTGMFKNDDNFYCLNENIAKMEANKRKYITVSLKAELLNTPLMLGVVTTASLIISLLVSKNMMEIFVAAAIMSVVTTSLIIMMIGNKRINMIIFITEYKDNMNNDKNEVDTSHYVSSGEKHTNSEFRDDCHYRGKKIDDKYKSLIKCIIVTSSMLLTSALLLFLGINIYNVSCKIAAAAYKILLGMNIYDLVSTWVLFCGSLIATVVMLLKLRAYQKDRLDI